MRSNDRESFAPAQPSNDSNEARLYTLMNPAARAPQLWMQATEALIDWYGAMFRLAFGLGRINGHPETSSAVIPLPEPPVERQETETAPPSQPPLAVVQSRPAAPVRLQPRRRKSPSTAANRSRSSKASRAKRRRAA